MNDQTINPCPFCGGNAEFKRTWTFRNGFVDYADEGLVECSGCDAYMYGKTEDKAIEAWNRRANETDRC